jgi:hypothetical protein
VPLRYTPLVYYAVDHTDLEAFAAEYYGRRYSVVAALECPNGTEHSVETRLTHDGWTGPYEDDPDPVELPGPDPELLQDVHLWRQGLASDPSPEALLNDLAWQGVVPAGQYLITVRL